MKAAFAFYKHPIYSKALYWSRLIIVTGGAQAIVQGTGLLTGFIIIRLLPTQEYAFYTLANTMLGTMTLLSDGGISNSIMAQGGKVWQNKTQLGIVLASGLELRKKFAIGSLSISLPLLGYLLYRNGADSLSIILITLTLIPSFLASLSDVLLEIAPKLHQEINSLQKNQTEVSFLRLFLSGISLFFLPVTATALLINGITRMYGNKKLAKIAYAHADKESKPNSEVKKEILNVVKRTLPHMIYYCFSGQIIVWIPSLLGNTTGVAQIGALGRLAMILNLFSTLVATLIIPRFARIDGSRNKDIFKLFFYIQLIMVLISVCIVSFFNTFPNQFLWILGNSYSNLSHELSLMILSSCVGLLSSQTARLIQSRGWFMHPLIIIGINLVSLIISYYIFDLSEITGVLYYDILLSFISYIFAIIYGTIQMKKPDVNK